jgi:hypothetical protein
VARSRRYGAAAAIAALLASGTAVAQMPPPVVQPAPPPVGAVNPVCMRLEGQLASLDQGGAGAAAAAAQRLRDAVAKQRSELDRTTAYARSLGCERRLFLFGPTPPPQCNEVNARVAAMRTNLDRLTSQAMRAQGGGELDMQRRQLIGALAQNNCGPQYRAAALQPPPQQRREGGLFGMLFGGGSSQQTYVQPQIMAPEDMPRASTWRTVCVRTCDGFFFPVSYSTVQSAFPRDEAICKITCPGTEARLFAYPNPGGAIEQAVSPTGEQYTTIPNAFKYRTEFVSDCSCKPDGMSWAEALQGVDDRTLRKGDIIVDEAKAEAMSRPKEAPPPKPEAVAKKPAPTRSSEPPAAAPEFDPFASDSTAPTAAD